MKRILLGLLTLVCAMALAQPMLDEKPTPADVAAYKQATKAYTAAKAAYTKKPSPTAKKTYVASTVKLGTTAMTSTALSRKEKYKVALRLYREALKLDPKNEEAKNNSAMIVEIYKSMGRPVPQ